MSAPMPNLVDYSMPDTCSVINGRIFKIMYKTHICQICIIQYRVDDM